MSKCHKSATRRAALAGCSAAVVLAASSAAYSQTTAALGSADEKNVIVVIGDRSIVASLRDVAVEQSYDEQDVTSYGVSTVGEVLGELRGENGDSDPALLVNGQPVADAGNIADLPVEAIARIERLPRGAAQRINGAAGQRAYNIVLRKRVRSATLTASREMATEGGWTSDRGEVLLTYVEGQDRIGVTFRGATSDALLESERDFIPRAEATPFAPAGNIIPAAGGEVDPRLSALAGQPVTVIGLSPGVTRPTLGDLLTGANRLNPADTSRFRTLRGEARPYEVAVAGAKTLASWLTLQLKARLTWSENDNLSGLPSARFLIPASNPFTPFALPVSLALNDPARPLASRSSLSSQSLSSSFNATVGEWRATLTGRLDNRRSSFATDRTGPLGALATVDAATNPFAGTLAALIPVTTRRSDSRNRSGQLSADAEGPLFNGWAGPVRGRAGLSAGFVDYDARDESGVRAFDRHEYLAKAGITLPLTSRSAAFGGGLGDSSIALDYGRVGLGRFGTLTRRSASFEWQPAEWLRGVVSAVRDERATAAELLAAPQVVNVNVPYVDPLTGATVDVTTIFGGAQGVDNERLRTRSVALTATPLARFGVQLDAAYVAERLRNQIGALPLPSPAVVAAFPDRFQRDAAGTLVLVDSRSVNFARQDTQQLRFGLRLALPLSKTVAGKGARGRIPPLRLAATASHTILLDSNSRIRDGLPEIDLLDGGAIGFGGGRQRHVTTGSVALTQGASGLRLETNRRGVSFLASGTPAAPDLLTFGALTTVDLKAFVDLGQALPKARLARNTKVTLTIDNLANRRQRVTTLAGDTPQGYQPVRRDPIGRTIRVELRKVF